MVGSVDRVSRTNNPLSRGRDLVAGAIAGIHALQGLLPAYVAGSASAAELRAALDHADIGGENLLRATRQDEAPRLLASLERYGDGTRLHAAVLALDPAATALSTTEGRGPLDRLLSAPIEETAGHARTLEARLAVAASALSVAASRLALQASFIEAILDEESDGTTPASDLPPLDQASARETALVVGAMLSRGPMPIVSGNRCTLERLFAAMSSGALSSGAMSSDAIRNLP